MIIHHTKQKMSRYQIKSKFINQIMKFFFDFSICLCHTSINKNQGECSTDDFRVFTYNELKAASNGFNLKNKIGEGGFGSVYKGRLQNGKMVAIKVLSIEIDSMRGEREFISELAALSDIKHDNLVTLQGCCVEGAKRFLVYDYMENNSLAHTFLGREQNRINFKWEYRRNTCISIARGLTYLHEEINPHIVHRDIKSRNILIDDNFNTKVSDFGLSRLFREDTSHISTRVAGTLGYLSPEYAISGHLTRKSDVYSYGVLVLEIVSGRSVVDFIMEHGEQFLVDKAWEMYNANKLVELVDPVLKGDYPPEEAVRFLKVGLLCVQETSKLRPRMSVVIKMLANEIDLDKVKILQPGFVADLMDVKIGHKHSANSSSTF